MANTMLKHPIAKIILVLAIIVVIVGFSTDWKFKFKKNGSKAGDDCMADGNVAGKIDENGNCIAVEGGPGQPGGGQGNQTPSGSSPRSYVGGACGDKAGQSCGDGCWYVNTPDGCECKCDKASLSRMVSSQPSSERVSACSGDDCSGVVGLPKGSCYQVNVNGQCRCHCFSNRQNCPPCGSLPGYDHNGFWNPRCCSPNA